MPRKIIFLMIFLSFYLCRRFFVVDRFFVVGLSVGGLLEYAWNRVLICLCFYWNLHFTISNLRILHWVIFQIFDFIKFPKKMDCDQISSNFIEIVQNILERGPISNSFSNFLGIVFTYIKITIAWAYLELLYPKFLVW